MDITKDRMCWWIRKLANVSECCWPCFECHSFSDHYRGHQEPLGSDCGWTMAGSQKIDKLINQLKNQFEASSYLRPREITNSYIPGNFSAVFWWKCFQGHKLIETKKMLDDAISLAEQRVIRFFSFYILKMGINSIIFGVLIKLLFDDTT